MKKYEVIKRTAIIKQKDRRKIAPGCTSETSDSDIIQSCETLEEARKKLKDYKTIIDEVKRRTDTVYEVTEYCIEENDYNVDDELVSSGFVWDYSKMEIYVIEKPSYEAIGTYPNFADAEDAKDRYDGSNEVFLSFSDYL